MPSEDYQAGVDVGGGFVARTNGSDAGNRFVDLMLASKRRHENNQAYCTRWLRTHFDIKAEHPDDGWINRLKGFFGLSYPAYLSVVEVSSLVAFGWPSHGDPTSEPAGQYRIARVTSIEDSFFGFRQYGYAPATSKFYIYHDEFVGEPLK